jgi:predicted Zn-dependent protease
MASLDRIEQIKSFLEVTPQDAFLKYALAIEFVGLNDDEKAFKIFTELINTDPNYFATYYHLAKLYERQEDEAKAIETYELGMKITASLNEKHAYGELRSALEELTF